MFCGVGGFGTEGLPRRRGWVQVGWFGRKFRQFSFIDFADFFLALPGLTRLDERRQVTRVASLHGCMANESIGLMVN